MSVPDSASLTREATVPDVNCLFDSILATTFSSGRNRLPHDAGIAISRISVMMSLVSATVQPFGLSSVLLPRRAWAMTGHAFLLALCMAARCSALSSKPIC